ncbi:toxin-antitoxin system, antitoxin component, PHD family protein [Lachnospiraceae bacterium OttesenSCG-928-E19]|nr:toxin-antitoxin system, antitoxin component, PHD family protein [Lachnospiraceae bacterium OttesenSCG-928-E19]
MDIETYNRRGKMLKLREELLGAQEDRIAGRSGCTLDELDVYLDEIISEV